MLSDFWLRFLYSHIQDTRGKRQTEIEALNKTIEERERRRTEIQEEADNDTTSLAWIEEQIRFQPGLPKEVVEPS